jgi:hypothetical protein
VKTLVKFLLAILLVLVVSVVVIGPGRLVAGAEYPLGVGPWGSTGRYCQDMFTLTRRIDVWHRSGAPVTPLDKTNLRALEKALTTSGPEVPRSDFTAFFRTSGNVITTMSAQAPLLNKWWNVNCTQMWMEAPSSLNRTWSGMLGHESFTHYPKNVVQLKDFIRVNG